MKRILAAGVALCFLLAAAHGDPIGDCQQVEDAEKSIRACSQLLQTIPKENETERAHTLVWRGAAFAAQGKCAQTLTDFEHAIALRPSLSPPRFLGLGYRLTLAVDKCLAAVERRIDRNPTQAALFLSRGRLHLMKRDFPAAVADFGRVISLNPVGAEGYARRAEALRRSRDVDRAISDYDAALALSPGDATLQEGRAASIEDRGIRALHTGALASAVTDFTTVISYDPTNTQAYAFRARAHLLTGDYAGAVADLDRAIELEPTRERHYFRGIAYSRCGKYEEAVADFNEAVRLTAHVLSGQTNELYSWRGYAHYRMQRYDQALADLDRADKISPHNELALLRRAIANRAAGHEDRAQDDLVSAKKMQRWSLARIVDVRVRLLDKSLISELNSKIADAPDNAELLMSRGAVHVFSDEYAKGVADFDAALSLDPTDAAAYAWRATARLWNGEFDLAADDFAKEIEHLPKNRWSSYFLRQAHVGRAIAFASRNELHKAEVQSELAGLEAENIR